MPKARKRKLREYSKGMARRIGLAQALINDPELILLDEPTTGLDPIGTREMKDLILSLKSQGKTVLLCSHLLADVQDVCDRITILFRGKMQTIGQVRDLLQRKDITQIETRGMTPQQIEQTVAFLNQIGRGRQLRGHASDDHTGGFVCTDRPRKHAGRTIVGWFRLICLSVQATRWSNRSCQST